MEEDTSGPPVSAAIAFPSRRRWNPTKEQKSILEAVYRQGVTTPTTEQILVIARRLREFGSVEGKNVFYWFQNHKARQRQRQRQEINRRLHEAVVVAGGVPSHPIYYPPTNVACDPVFGQSTGITGQYSRFPQALVSKGGIINIPIPTTLQMYEETWEAKSLERCVHPRLPDQACHNATCDLNYSKASPQTLQLFPLHPTGILTKGCVDDHHPIGSSG